LKSPTPELVNSKQWSNFKANLNHQKQKPLNENSFAKSDKSLIKEEIEIEPNQSVELSQNLKWKVKEIEIEEIKQESQIE